MSRFEREWALVPTAARVIAVLAALALVALVASAFLAQPPAEDAASAAVYWGLFLLATIIPGGLIAVFTLLVGYVWGDAKRRRMNAVLWLLLAIFVPNAIGLVLYFILRDPIPAPCPSCGTPAGKDQAFCAACGTEVRRSCPSCQNAVQDGWSHCGHCGAELKAGATT